METPIGTPRLDRTDKRILDLLRRDPRATKAEIGRQVHLNRSNVSRRMEKLRRAGFLLDTGVVNNKSSGLQTVFCRVRFPESNASSDVDLFQARIQEFPAVVEFCRVSGDLVDYIIKMVVTDVSECDAIWEKTTKGLTLNQVLHVVLHRFK